MPRSGSACRIAICRRAGAVAGVASLLLAGPAGAIEFTPSGRIEGMRCGGMPVNMIDRNSCDAVRAHFARWLPRAHQCDPEAEWQVGARYLGDRRSAPLALPWLERAAQQGLDAAQRALADTLEGGHGVPADAVRAAGWWLVLARADDTDAVRSAERELAAMSPEARMTARAWAERWRPAPCAARVSATGAGSTAADAALAPSATSRRSAAPDDAAGPATVLPR
jgi:TPR repeat protein